MSDGYRYPFTPYPRGWYRLARSSDVRPVGCRLVPALGSLLRLERDEGGALRCAGELPLCERNHLVFGWFDPSRGAPTFDVPHLDEHSSPRWLPPFSLRWKIRVHIQEVAENALDLSHFAVVHTYLAAPELRSFVLDGPHFSIELAAARRLFGRRVGTDTHIKYYGLGVVAAQVRTPMVGLRVLLTTTPIDVEYVELCMEVAIEKSRSALWDLIVRAMMPREIADEFERDIPVWEAKRYLSRPLLCRSEGNIMQIRRWARQFYDPAAPQRALSAA
jgi:hypothetical protein